MRRYEALIACDGIAAPGLPEDTSVRNCKNCIKGSSGVFFFKGNQLSEYLSLLKNNDSQGLKDFFANINISSCPKTGASRWLNGTVVG